MGRLIIPKTRDYLYKAFGTGLSPNINGLRFYDSGLIYNDKKSFYSEDGQYAIWYWGGFPTAIWLIGTIANIGTFTTNAWGKVGATDTVSGSYIAAGDKVGTVTISEYKNNISIKKQNLGGGRIIAKASDIPLSKLQLWLKGDIGVVYDENALVSAWNDQSGNNRNFTKSIANTGYPIYTGNSVLFTTVYTYGDPDASILALPSASLNFTTPYTLIAVIRAGAVEDQDNNNATIFSKSTDSPKRRKYQIALGGGIIYSLESTGADTNISYDTGTGDDVGIKRLIVSQYSSNTFGLIRYNGEEVATSSVNVGIDQTNNASIFIGASPFSEGTGYNAEASAEMYVYEIIFYNRALTTIEIQKIETYLNKKYLIY
jgi:hypothetical protein